MVKGKKFDVDTLAAGIGRELETLKASDSCKQALRAIVVQHQNKIGYLQEQVDNSTLVGVKEIMFDIHLTDNDERDVQVGRAVQWAVRHGMQTRGNLETRGGHQHLVIECAEEFDDD